MTEPVVAKRGAVEQAAAADERRGRAVLIPRTQSAARG